MRRAASLILASTILTACSGGARDAGSTSVVAPLVSDQARPDTSSDANVKPFFAEIAYAPGMDERVHFQDLIGAARASSVVLLGRVTSVATSRSAGDSAIEAITYTNVVVRPTRVLRGTLPTEFANAVNVEFIGSPGAADAIREVIPQGDGLWFLHRKGEGFPKTSTKSLRLAADESRYYRLVSSQGLFFQGDRSVINPVLPPETPEAGNAGQVGPTPPRDAAVVQGESFTTLNELLSFLESRF